MTGKDQPARPGKDVACESCGSFDALEVAGRFLCAGCVTLAGSACAGLPDDARDE